MTVSEKLRLVQGLHSHAEMFGFKWEDGSDWTWHDVTCKIADEVDAENAKLREYVQTLEAANLDVTSRLQDYIGQYDPTDAFVIEAKAENAKLRRAFNETLIRLVAANDVAVSNYMDDEYLELMRELGIEVGDDTK